MRFRCCCSGTLTVLLLSLAVGRDVAAQASAPVGLDSLNAPVAAVGPAGSGMRLDRVILKLSPGAGREAHRALGDGFGAAMADPRAAALDTLLRRKQVHRLYRVFRTFTRSDIGRVLRDYGKPPGPSGLSCADPTGATAPCVSP